MGQQASKAQDLTGLSPSENYFGFINFGNTCYMNSVLQSLYHCIPLRNKILDYYRSYLDDKEKKTQSEINKLENSFLIAIGEAFHFIDSNPKQNGVYRPKKLLMILQKQNESFRGSMHQDAHEFLNYILNELAEALEYKQDEGEKKSKHPHKTGNTFIHELFEGLLTNETRCLCCENITNRDESFLDLSIDVEQNTSVTHCMRNFSSVETLRGTDKFYCDICGSLQEAEKRMRVKALPEILVVHLKRFKYVEINQRHTLVKLSHRVVFPFDIKIPNTSKITIDPERKYELYAIVIHLGTGGNYGHYISVVKSCGNWILFDDDTFRKVDPQYIKAYFGNENEYTTDKTCSYLLFYQHIKS